MYAMEFFANDTSGNEITYGTTYWKYSTFWIKHLRKDPALSINLVHTTYNQLCHFASIIIQVGQYNELLENTSIIFFRHQWTPMHMAAAKGRFENILGYLVGKDAGINIKDNNGVRYYTINN